MFQIDDQLAYFGGMNIGREYRYDWREAMFVLSGPVVDALSCRFDAAWLQAKGDPLTALKLPQCKLPVVIDDRCDPYLTATTPFFHDLYIPVTGICTGRHCIFILLPATNPAAENISYL